MKVNFKFRYSSADYGLVQKVAMRAYIGRWYHDWGFGYCGKVRLAKLEHATEQMLKHRFWRYIGAV